VDYFTERAAGIFDWGGNLVDVQFVVRFKGRRTNWMVLLSGLKVNFVFLTSCEFAGCYAPVFVAIDAPMLNIL